MVRLRTVEHLTPDERSEVLRFLDDAHTLDCARLNDHLRLDLAQGPRPGFLAVLAHDGDELAGYAQASAGNDGFVIDGIVWSNFDGDVDEARHQALRALVDRLPGDSAITWWAHPDATSAGIAARLGMQADRALRMMERALPIDTTAGVAVRPFRVGHDEAGWLSVNNAAFAGHGEQGGWDDATLRQREHETWFDPEGFLLHERDGRLAAFCWTKMHPGAAPDGGLAGEIYVIAVHPDFHGLGLGRALTVAGLEHMHHVGASSALLYVDATNTSAVRLYESLGFTIGHTEQSYRRPGGTR